MSDAKTTRREITLDERDMLVDYNRRQALDALGLDEHLHDTTTEELSAKISDDAWSSAAEAIERAAKLAKDRKQPSLRTSSSKSSKDGDK